VESGKWVPPEGWSGGYICICKASTLTKEQLIVESYRFILGTRRSPVPPGHLAELVPLFLPGCGGFHISKMSWG
jgi:hypothetical protein